MRKYGKRPFSCLVLHGGPGAAGGMAPLAKKISLFRGVLEPMQTKDSLAGQVRELRDSILAHASSPVCLVGWSWGAWLGYIVAARYPALVRRLVLISAGPFEEKYAAGIMRTRLGRLSEEEQAEFRAGVSLKRLGELCAKADAFDPVRGSRERIRLRPDIYERVWPQAARLRSSGRLLELGRRIRCPVMAIHGDYDPHPWQGVAKPLGKIVRDFRFRFLRQCGHTPWKERRARQEFLRILEQETGVR